MTGYNGIIQIEVNHLANRMEVNRVKQEVLNFHIHSQPLWVPEDIP